MASPSRQIVLRMTSDPAEIAPVRRTVEAFAGQCGLDDKAVADVGLCLNEALANIIRHAYDHQPGRPIEITAGDLVPGVELRLRDWGNGVDPSTRPPRPYKVLEPGGLGIICLNTLMDAVAYTPQIDGMLLTMRKTR